MRNSRKPIRNVYGNATFNKIGHWAIRLTAPETEEQSSMIYLAQAVLSQLLILKCCSVMMYPSAGNIMITLLWTAKDEFLWTLCLEGTE